MVSLEHKLWDSFGNPFFRFKGLQTFLVVLL
ncbi:hypothetical protein NCTGTJJY_CDS0230 [Serratia phage 92A1]|nr:hypothetical protein NCTGTJJY_CDS0230 [Serratia phage 92A1]